MPDDDQWIECPECDKKVKYKNLGRHFLRVHGMTPSESRKKVEESGTWKEKKSKKKRIPRKVKLFTTFIVLMMVMSFATSLIILWTGNDDDDDDDDGNGDIVTDPNRVEFTTSDGFRLVGSFYGAIPGVVNTSTVDRPTLILVHGMNERRSVWYNYGFVDDALSWGFNVLTFDIRMHGESLYKNGEKVDVNTDDLKTMDLDVEAAVAFVNANYPTNGRFAVVGASIGANAALKASVFESSIRSIVLLSPSLNFPSQNIPSYDPIWDTGPRPVFIACSELESNKDDCERLAEHADDPPFADRNVQLEIYPTVNYHGTNLFKLDAFSSDLESWLKSTMLA
jgi:pimeloyl-ACP methyl ester carboxylesterase